MNSFSEWAANEYRRQGVTVMTLCPGFTQTEFHERMGVRRGSGFLWLDAGFLVDKALADFDKGRVFSVPGAQYKTIVGLTRLVPSRLSQRFQSMGRKYARCPAPRRGTTCSAPSGTARRSLEREVHMHRHAPGCERAWLSPRRR